MAFVVAVAGCEPQVEIGTVLTPELIERRNAIDILFVVDNSASMAEEQAALARSFLSNNCPVQDLENVPDVLAGAEPALLEELGDTCGFAQILAASQRDFQIGVITTDVNTCDNILGLPNVDTRYQRGCLQRVPDTGEKVLRKGDSAIAEKFAALVTGVGVSGSPIERGIDAALAFLEGDVADDSCAGDLDALIRPDALLLIVYVTDEDDCSHSEDSPDFVGRSEVCGQDFNWLNAFDADACYRNAELLDPVSQYSARLLTLRGDDVRVAFIGGVVDDEPAGCRYVDDAITTECVESRGNSNRTGPGQQCDESAVLCCTSDAGRRYMQLSRELSGPLAGSICQPSFSGALAKALARTIR